MPDAGPFFANIATEADWSMFAAPVIPTGVLDDGFTLNPLQVTATGLTPSVTVAPGRAYAAGFFGQPAGGVAASVTLAANLTASPRTDLIVMRLDIGATPKSFAPYAVTGVAGSPAVEPTPLNGPTRFDVPLFAVAIPANFRGSGPANVAQSWLTDRRFVFRNATRRPRGWLGYDEVASGSVTATTAAGVAIPSLAFTLTIPAGRLVTITAGGVLTNGSATAAVTARFSIYLGAAEFAFDQKSLPANVNSAGVGVFGPERTFVGDGTVYAFTVAVSVPAGTGSVGTSIASTYPSWLKLVDFGASP